ncbi:MAG: DUF3606 domain-containing protein [Xanthomonadaceae bacterium]|nr:DUF3606 domain-containing protein [Xanthomonadaceae bacterium]
MLTDLYARGPRDLSRIDVLDPYEVRYWTNRFGCTERALLAAVADVGAMVPNVDEYLRLVRWQAAHQSGQTPADEITLA